VAIVVADFYINRNPQNRHFNWAWAAQETLAGAAGLSRRTVATAMDELERTKLIIVDRGGGRKGDRGRTHRYTLRMDHLNEVADDQVEQNLHSMSTSREVNILHNSIDIPDERSCANNDTDMGNLGPEEANGFPTTPSNISLEDSLYGDHPKADVALVPSKRLTREKSKISKPIQSFTSTRNHSSVRRNYARSSKSLLSRDKPPCHIHPGAQGVVGIVNQDEGHKRGGDQN
jgi:hypothetical protein